jgi:hypothetical protein
MVVHKTQCANLLKKEEEEEEEEAMIVHKKPMCKFVEKRRRGRSHGNPQNTMSKSVEEIAKS